MGYGAAKAIDEFLAFAFSYETQISVLNCLYISRYAGNRSKTDPYPYTGLAWFLSGNISLPGLWRKRQRGSVAFAKSCRQVIEVDFHGKRWSFQ